MRSSGHAAATSLNELSSVVRLTYDDVMRRPDDVRGVLEDAVATRRATGCAGCRVA